MAATVTRGALSWRFGLRPDGTWPADGAAPCAMDWGARGNPAGTLPDLGATLLGLWLEHPEPDAVAALHRMIGLADPPEVRPGPAPRYGALIATPAGPRTLS